MAMSRRAWIVGVMIVLAAGASGAWFYTQSRGSTARFRSAMPGGSSPRSHRRWMPRTRRV